MMNNNTSPIGSSSLGSSISSAANNAASSVRQAASNLSSSISNTVGNMEQGITNGVQSLQSGLQEFGSQSATSITNADFLDTNSIIAKTVFILLVVVLFMIMLRMFIFLIGYFMSPNPNPYLVKGMLPGNDPIHITRDPQQTNYVVLPRSNNRDTGLEFTWSVWLNLSIVNQPSGNHPDFMHVFNVGNNTYDAKTGLATVNNGPGMYLQLVPSPVNNASTKKDSVPGLSGMLSLHIIMDTESVADVDTSNTYIDIDDVPYNKWFHVALRVENMVMDVYINGLITQRLSFQNTPKQNYNDIYICQNGGFDGNMSNLQYYSRALNVFDINSIVFWGPNLSSPLIAGTQLTNSVSKMDNYNYISSNWYYNKMGPDLMQF